MLSPLASTPVPDIPPGVDDLSNMYGLTDLFGTILGYMTQLFNIYTTTWILTGMLAIWLLRRVVRLFKRL